MEDRTDNAGNFALRSLILATALPLNPGRVRSRVRLALYLLSISGVIFRSELAILLAAESLLLLVRKRISLVDTVIPSLLTGVSIGLFLTVPIDSFFWQTFPLWPEWVGFYYNTILGKASDWGTSPWHFYFLNSIPRLLMNPAALLVCIPLAIVVHPKRGALVQLMIPLLAYVAVYSVIPHKEWRFIVYVVPGLTTVAAAGAAWIWMRRFKSILYRGLSAVLLASTLASFVASFGLLAVSRLNYPGGEALSRLHQVAHTSKGVIRVHLDDLSCQTGVTHFQENGLLGVERTTAWIYDKTENETQLLDPAFWQQFDYALVERPERAIGKWEIMDVVFGFAGINLARPSSQQRDNTFSYPGNVFNAKQSTISRYWQITEVFLRENVTFGWWPTIKMQPKITILRRQDTTTPVPL